MLKLKCVCTVIYVLKEVCMYVCLMRSSVEVEVCMYSYICTKVLCMYICLMRSSVEVEVCMYSYICTKGSVYVCMFDEIEC